MSIDLLPNTLFLCEKWSYVHINVIRIKLTDGTKPILLRHFNGSSITPVSILITFELL